MMIKLVLLLVIFSTSFFASGQSTRVFEVYPPDGEVELRNVGNFTIIDSDGVSWTLYDELDNGRTVMFDIFSAT
jgi:hypothetical protein